MEVKTYNTLEQLQEQHKNDVEGWTYNDTCDYLEEHEKSNVSDILETDISFSYRVFYKNGNTRYFKQWVKP